MFSWRSKPKPPKEEPLSSTMNSYLQDAASRPHWVPVLYSNGPESQSPNLAPLITFAFEQDCDRELDHVKAKLTPEGQEWIEANREDLRQKLVDACWQVVQKQSLSIQEFPTIAPAVAKILWEAMERCP